MKFGDTTLDEAVGAILAHSVRLDGATLKKGRVLSADDVVTREWSASRFARWTRSPSEWLVFSSQVSPPWTRCRSH